MSTAVGGIAPAAPPIATSAASSSLTLAAPATTVTPAFSALPASYAGFGTGGTPFGTVGISGNALAIVTHGETQAATSTASSGPAAAPKDPPADPPANDPPAKDPPSDPPQPAYTAVTLQDVTTLFQLSSVNERFAIANAQGDSAAAAQIKPFAVSLTAKLNDQTFGGLGTTPAQPFAQPEIPPVFLNLPA